VTLLVAPAPLHGFFVFEHFMRSSINLFFFDFPFVFIHFVDNTLASYIQTSSASLDRDPDNWFGTCEREQILVAYMNELIFSL